MAECKENGFEFTSTAVSDPKFPKKERKYSTFGGKDEEKQGRSLNAKDSVVAHDGAKTSQSQSSDNFGDLSVLEKKEDPHHEDKRFGKKSPKNENSFSKTEAVRVGNSSRAIEVDSKGKIRVMTEKNGLNFTIEKQVQAIRVREIHRRMAELARERLRRRKQPRKLTKKSKTASDSELQSAVERARFIEHVETITEQLRVINFRLDKRMMTLEGRTFVKATGDVKS